MTESEQDKARYLKVEITFEKKYKISQQTGFVAEELLIINQ